MSTPKKLFAFVLCVAGIAGSASAVVRFSDTPLGSIPLNGGQESTSLSSAAITNGNTVSATLPNDLDPQRTITDLTVIVRRKGSTGNPPNPGTITASPGGDKEPAATPAGDGESAHFDGLSVDSNSSIAVTIAFGDPGTAADVEFAFTPSTAVAGFGGANIFDLFEISSSTDLIRKGLGWCDHDRFVADVKNTHASSSITSLGGTVLFPTGSSAVISDVRLLDPANGFQEVSGATITHGSSNFNISGITLAHGAIYEVLVVTSVTFTGQNVRLTIEGHFQN